MNISIGAEKAFDTIQVSDIKHLSQSLRTLGIKKEHKLKKDLYKKPKASIILNGFKYTAWNWCKDR